MLGKQSLSLDASAIQDDLRRHAATALVEANEVSACRQASLPRTDSGPRKLESPAPDRSAVQCGDASAGDVEDAEVYGSRRGQGQRHDGAG
jgi:hypothetical protein